MGNGEQYRAFSLRGRRRLSDGRFSSGEQSRSLHLQVEGLRKDVEGNHERHSAQHVELRALHQRGSRASRTLVRGNGKWSVCFIQRRRELGTITKQYAARAGLLDGCSGALQ